MCLHVSPDYNSSVSMLIRPKAAQHHYAKLELARQADNQSGALDCSIHAERV
jgi:hypothetical protein